MKSGSLYTHMYEQYKYVNYCMKVCIFNIYDSSSLRPNKRLGQKYEVYLNNPLFHCMQLTALSFKNPLR